MKQAAYLNPGLSPEKRAADLVKRLDLRQLVVQMRNFLASRKTCYAFDDNDVYLHPDFTRYLKGADAVGSLQCLTRSDFWTMRFPGEGYSRRNYARIANKVQEYAIAHNPWKIPLLLFDDCRHGVPGYEATVFPAGIAQAASFSPELLKKIGRHIAREMRGIGIHVSIGPNLNLASDPRWARMEECYGEDPFLAGTLGAAYIRGIQKTTGNGGIEAIAAMHFIGAMGHAENGLDARPANLGAVLTEQILRPFGAGARAGAFGGMASYSSLDGIPGHADRKILTEFLREENHFRGFVEGDANGVYGLEHESAVSDDPVECAALAVNAGLDIDLFAMDGDYYRFDYIQQALDRGLIEMDTIRRRAYNVLLAKFALGLFENPYTDPGQVKVSGGHRLALEAAKESMILLKNRNGILPLDPQTPRKMAVIGPHADDVFNMLGDYTPFVRRKQVTTILDGIRKTVPHWQVFHSKGCNIKTGTEDMLRTAVETAQKSDVILLTLGGSSNRYGLKFNDFGGGSGDIDGSDADCGEGLDRATLELFPAQQKLFRALLALEKPLIVALVHGRPCCVEEIAENADGIVDLWYPGEAGGEALAQLLFGKQDFCGRLPVSIPRHAGQLPVSYHTQRPKRQNYIEMTSAPRWNFGYGLSYAKIEYLDAKLNSDKIRAGEKIALEIELKNVSGFPAMETIQVYITDEFSSLVKPVKELCAVKKIHLPPGSKTRAVLSIPPEAMETLQSNGSKSIESGSFILSIGNAGETFLSVRFQVEA